MILQTPTKSFSSHIFAERPERSSKYQKKNEQRTVYTSKVPHSSDQQFMNASGLLFLLFSTLTQSTPSKVIIE